jgi:hypothetical protein
MNYGESQKRDFDFGLWYGCHAFLFRTDHERQIVALVSHADVPRFHQEFSGLSSFVHKCVMIGSRRVLIVRSVTRGESDCGPFTL